MLRVRLKADGRIVEILPDGTECAMPATAVRPINRTDVSANGDAAAGAALTKGAACENPAAYARRIRGATQLSQNDFAARIGVPVETVRNWEQGKRAPRGPARALLRIIDRAPDTAFAVLGERSGAAS